MQEFKMSLSELEDKFYKSEMAIMAWSSNEQMAKLSKKRPKRQSKKNEVDDFRDSLDNVEQQPNVPKEFLNEEGEVDLRKMTGRQAVKYLNSMGMHFVPMKR